LLIWEKRAKSFYQMGFTSLEFVHFDCCCSGRLTINSYNQLVEGGEIGQAFDGPHSDMSWALRMHNPLKSQAYLGWWGPVPEGNPPPVPEDAYQKWTRNMWKKLGEGDDFYQALLYAISQQTDFTPKAPANNFRLKGEEEDFLWEIYLRNDY
jgi:hypothetical protein